MHTHKEHTMVAIRSRDGTVLHHVNAPTLQRGDLRGASLPRADLRGADLLGANLCGADLWNADLTGATLRGARLTGATLAGAILQGADLLGALLRRVDLLGADLRGADLRGAALQHADLEGADLRGADLRGAILPTGESWEQYCAGVVPALCQAGGRTLAEVAAAWTCQAVWELDPMAVAFGVQALQDVPLLYRPRVDQFNTFFDAGLLPCPSAGGSAEPPVQP